MYELFAITLMLFGTEPPQSYSGTWQLAKDGNTQLVLDRKGETIHVTEEHDGKTRADYTCKLDGKDCDFKEDGHKGKVSLWFNGAYLVELRSHGDSITKRRFSLKDDSKTLQLEIMPMSPPGKTETVAYSRAK